MCFKNEKYKLFLSNEPHYSQMTKINEKKSLFETNTTKNSRFPKILDGCEKNTPDFSKMEYLDFSNQPISDGIVFNLS